MTFVDGLRPPRMASAPDGNATRDEPRGDRAPLPGTMHRAGREARDLGLQRRLDKAGT